MVVDQPSPNVHGPAVVFPVGQYGPHTTCLILEQTADFLPRTAWVGVAAELGVPVESAAEAVTFAAAETMVPLLPEHWRGLLTRPGLRGFRQLPDGQS